MALALRGDWDAAQLRMRARQSDNADQVRRLLALAAIYDGASRTEAAAIGGVTRQIVRDWVERLNTGGPDALVTRKAPGTSSLLSSDQRAALAQAVEDGPTPAIDGVGRPAVALPRAASQLDRQKRWRLVDLVGWVRERFALSLSRQTLGRELRAMRCRKLSARPRHRAQAPGAGAAFRKTSPAS